jgi:uncharacterized protein (DUF2236 family)
VRPTIRDILRGFPAPPQGAAGDPGLFGPGSLVWRVNGETVLLAGGARALLMQIAHPSVAAGVADHSGFDRDPWERLWATLSAVLDVAFGDLEQARAAAGRVTGLHAHVTGSRDGTGYSALDPELLRWVHLTLVDSALVTYERLVGRIGPRARDRYVDEMRRFGESFGVPASVLPADGVSLAARRDAVVASLRVSEDARRLLPGVISPPVPLALRPAATAARLLTVWLLPPAVRDGFGLPWDLRRERAARLLATSIRTVLPVVPPSVRRWPHARTAERRVGTAG